MEDARLKILIYIQNIETLVEIVIGMCVYYVQVTQEFELPAKTGFANNSKIIDLRVGF